jgi:hypothetical protein
LLLLDLAGGDTKVCEATEDALPQVSDEAEIAALA